MESLKSQEYQNEVVRTIREETGNEKREQIPESEERPFWGEFQGGEIDEVGEYIEPTPAQQEKFQKRNERMAEIFKNADFEWYLDGAVNISLYDDRQIRDHKDLDMSIFKEDLEKLQELLFKQEFGIFVNFEDSGKRLMRPATPEELLSGIKLNLSICKVGKDGKIIKENPEPFNFVDLHIHDKDTDGNTVINYNEAVLPKELFEPIKKVLASGQTINLSQPVIVAYHKLHSDRPYDQTDLQKLRPKLKEGDFKILHEVLEIEKGKDSENAKEKLKELWISVLPLLEVTREPSVIAEKLWTYSEIKKRKNDPKISEYINTISEYISKNINTSFEEFLELSLVILKPNNQIEQKLNELDKLEKS